MATRLLSDIRAYMPGNDQEIADKKVIVSQLENNPDVFSRSSLAHVTCSAWTVDPARAQTLMVHHIVYGSWSWIGGHSDGERNIAKVALRELMEETGVQGSLVDCGPGKIFSLEVLTVDGHRKNGLYVGSHLHLNITYLVEADPHAPLRVAPDENTGVRWVPLSQVKAMSSEPWIRDRIYDKLIKKTQLF